MTQAMESQDLYRALAALARRYQFRSQEEVCCYGMTVSQCYALQALFESGVMPASRLSLALGLDLSSTTRLVDRLVRKKLVSRRRGCKDGRVREIEITVSGARLITRVEKDFGRWLSAAIADFPVAVRKAVPEVLRRLAGVLGSGCPPPASAISGTNRKRAP